MDHIVESRAYDVVGPWRITCPNESRSYPQPWNVLEPYVDLVRIYIWPKPSQVLVGLGDGFGLRFLKKKKLVVVPSTGEGNG